MLGWECILLDRLTADVVHMSPLLWETVSASDHWNSTLRNTSSTWEGEVIKCGQLSLAVTTFSPSLS